MKHRRFRVSPEKVQGTRALIDDPREVRHIRRVLRLKEGDPVVLFDGEGREYPATIARISPEGILFSRSPQRDSQAADSPCPIILGIALLKSSKFDWLLQKATELGVSEVVPFQSSRVVPRWEEEQARSRQSRWEKIASEAAKQCGRTRVPRVHPLRSFAEALSADFGEAARIFLWEKGEGEGLGSLLKKTPPGVFVLVGPEGGFSDEEALRAREAGFQPVRLGPRILRAETAGIAVVALLQFLLGDLGR